MPTRIIGERERELVLEVLADGRLSCLEGGPMAGRFEAAFAAAHGAEHGVAMNSAMSVLHASVLAAGAGAGDEVICDPICVFGAVATLYANAVPVFVDVHRTTWNMNADLIEERITPRTRALIVTHVWGLAAEMDRIVEVAHRHGLLVIEDCAHAMLTRYKGRCVGTWGDIGSFSFQASKQMGLGDGGMALTNSKDLAASLALHAGAPTFHSVAHGLHYNYRMTELVAALGLAQVERLPSYIEGLRAAARYYDDAVADYSFVTLQRGPDEAEHSFHLWGANFLGAEAGIPRADLERVLAEEQCSVGVGYTGMPAYRHPLISKRLAHGLHCPVYTGDQDTYPDGLCPVAEEVFHGLLYAYPMRPDDDVKADADRLHLALGKLQ